ncbi:MAG TPA: hypothetical protein VH413_15255 [Verrucomicrobiae bacterium]|nr:hypothetical protein [Verrucomicrobiae bacterium]
MTTSKNIKTVIGIAAATSLLATGCVIRERTYVPGPPPPPPGEVSIGGEVDVSGPPPAPLVEVQPVAPDPAFIWIGGVWVWGGGGWHWEHGRWARPPHRGAVWVQPRYAYRGGRHVWVRGGWR